MSEPVIPPPQPQALSQALLRNIDALDRRRALDQKSASLQDRIAQAITSFTGSMLFVYIHLAVYGAWIAINLGVFATLRPFDPQFVILASEASVEAIFLSTFVLISQNRMQAAADKRAELDLHISLLAEHELTQLAVLVRGLAEKFGIEVPVEIADVEKNIAPEAILDEIESANTAARPA